MTKRMSPERQRQAVEILVRAGRKFLAPENNDGGRPKVDSKTIATVLTEVQKKLSKKKPRAR